MKLERLRKHLRSTKTAQNKPKEDHLFDDTSAIRSMLARPCEKCKRPRVLRRVHGALAEAHCDPCRMYWRGSPLRCPGCKAPVSRAGVHCYDCDETSGESIVGQPVCDEDAFEFCSIAFDPGSRQPPWYLLRCKSCRHEIPLSENELAAGASCPHCGKGPARKLDA